MSGVEITKSSVGTALDDLKEFCRLNRIRVNSMWVAGSAARILVGKQHHSTFDIDVVTDIKWTEEQARKLEGTQSVCKTGFGDWKVTLVSGIVVDFITCEVGRYLRRVPTAWDGILVHLGSDTVITTREFHSQFNFEIASRGTSKPNYKPYYQNHLIKQGIIPMTPSDSEVDRA